MRYEFRPARATELAEVTEVVAEAYQPWAIALGFRPPPMDADYAGLIEAERVYVMGHGGVDGIVVLVDEDDCLLVQNVAVRPGLQGQGVGRALLGFAEREAARRGLSALRLYTHEKMASNVALYLALGYVETDRQPISVGNLVHLRKTVAMS
ncbi:MAG: GNAT family N-acetyltransferase [Acidimicrobiales bacterium]|nr:MAG: GNAT family N-acetyltransferase [Acidimicrobiales bacterium]